MKRVVTGGDLTQRDMRPPALLDTYLSLVESDISRLGLFDGVRQERSCPACGGGGAVAFERLGFPYRRCGACASLFVSPIPDFARLEMYWAQSEAERYWRDTVLSATAPVRARHALGPRVHWVAAAAGARIGTGLTVCDIGGRDPRLRELLLATPAFTSYVSTAASGDRRADVVVAFEALERAPNFDETLACCRTSVRPGGLLFVSTLSGSGFEVRLLGGQMRSLVPPVHLQLLSKVGWVAALERSRFRLVEYSTPGELDVQAVAEACRLDPALQLPPIVEELVRQDDEAVARSFQEVLQQAGLSAHVQFEAVAMDNGQGGE